MIKLSKLVEKDMTIFEAKKVMLCGWNNDSSRLYTVLNFLNIDVLGYTIYNKERQPSVGRLLKNKLMNHRYIKPDALESFLLQQCPNEIVLQLAETDKENLEKLHHMLIDSKFAKSNLSSGEIIASFSYLMDLSNLNSRVRFIYKRLRSVCGHRSPAFVRLPWKEFCSTTHENAIIVCSPPKTADTTLNFTFDLLQKKQNSSNFSYINLWHQPSCIHRSWIKKTSQFVKIIMGVREPISQNLSMLYHELGKSVSIENIFYRELFENQSSFSRQFTIAKYEEAFANGLDVQSYWDIYTNFYVDGKANKSYQMGFIQDFIPIFKKHALDITAYPFDKEKGYAIIKEGNVEIFIYQLEKLNNLVLELSEWVGIPFDKLEKGNVAEDKWIADSYKQAQKEIKITQEYFDKCFDEPYVKHCYSEADIEKFKARWRPHIKKEA